MKLLRGILTKEFLNQKGKGRVDPATMVNGMKMNIVSGVVSLREQTPIAQVIVKKIK